MSADQLGRIFQPFTQADASTTRRFGGTGLGLSICQRLAELMGGRIWAESEEGRGSVFHFRLPLGVARGEAVTRHGAPKETTVAAGEDAEAIVAGMRVLVVEDNLLNQEIVAAVLDTAGILVDLAGNGREAVDAIVGSPADRYDAVLMDVQMPEMDGLTATRMLRASPVGRSLPIIAMTAHVLEADVKECLDAGMTGHVGKPIDRREILEILARVRSRDRRLSTDRRRPIDAERN